MLSKEEATKFINENQNIIVKTDASYMYIVDFFPKEVVTALFARAATNNIVAHSSEELCCKLEALLKSFEEPRIKDGFVMGYCKTEYTPKGIRPIPFARENIEAVTNEIMFFIDCLR